MNEIEFEAKLKVDGRNRKIKRAYDTDLYKERNIIERFFSKLKQVPPGRDAI